MNWFELYEAHQAIRSQGHAAVREIRGVLRRLNALPESVLNPDAFSRFQPVNTPGGHTRTVRLGGRQGEYLAVWNLSEQDQEKVELEDAELRVELLLSKDGSQIHMLTVSISGKTKPSGDADPAPWTLAVHLPDDRITTKNPGGDRQGHGACGHAALHCHVGPDAFEPPKVRAPMPALSAGQILEWVISQVIPCPDHEPAPWSEREAS